MRPIEYSTASTVPDALEHLRGAPEAVQAIGGGTNLVDLLKLDVQTPGKLVDVNALPWAQITDEGDFVRVGALVRNSDLAHDPMIRERFPVLSEALLAGASPQLRNMATVGGNLMQRTRCSYFRDVSQPCNKRSPGSGCGAMNGYNRMHAVLGTSDKCIAAHPSDMCVALVALDAKLTLQGEHGQRTVAVGDFHLEPGQHPERETQLQPGELITSVLLPKTPFARTSRYLKTRDRASYAFALTSAAVALHLEGKRMVEVRVALGGVGTKPWRSREAESVLRGQTASEAQFAKAAEAAMKGARPHKFNAFKVELAQRTLRRALAMALEVA